ncbi:hypothetical protein [Arcobacter sp. LA11]|uniref:hypothetical protein n=1 Tax=Arcobacter sp. LA11 TaxID=1898176 RepID=UPI000932C24F|nr:hypothetical protein [Arcobacter sp. LA11]
MIEYSSLISDENGYKRFNHFEISKDLENILADDYHTYNTDKFSKDDLVTQLYKKNFVDKYDRDTQKEIFSLYIDNEKFKEKAQFVYSIIDIEKYINFVNENSQVENPNELTVKYSILDSEGVKVQIYNLTINDISFVF